MSIEISEELENDIMNKIEKVGSYDEVVGWLVLSDICENKRDAREIVGSIGEKYKLKNKKLNKSEELKEWFFSLDKEEMLSIKKVDVKKECVNIGMKGGSIDYYCNSYMLSVAMYKELVKKDDVV